MLYSGSYYLVNAVEQFVESRSGYLSSTASGFYSEQSCARMTIFVFGGNLVGKVLLIIRIAPCTQQEIRPGEMRLNLYVTDAVVDGGNRTALSYDEKNRLRGVQFAMQPTGCTCIILSCHGVEFGVLEALADP